MVVEIHRVGILPFHSLTEFLFIHIKFPANAIDIH